MNNFLCDVQDLYPLQKEEKMKKQRKGLGARLVLIVLTLLLYCPTSVRLIILKEDDRVSH